MKTRDRILLCTLDLFNEQGEPNVTTLDIANELEISPGNLYYHFRGKEALLESLLEHFQEHTRDLLVIEEDLGALSPDDYWLFLHLLFEAILAYRFLFQDLSHLMGRYDFISREMRAWLRALRSSLSRLLQALRDEDHMQIDDGGLERLLDALCQTFLFWLDYQRIVRGREADPASGVQQVLGLIRPYMDTEGRAWVGDLIERYA